MGDSETSGARHVDPEWVQESATVQEAVMWAMQGNTAGLKAAVGRLAPERLRAVVSALLTAAAEASVCAQPILLVEEPRTVGSYPIPAKLEGENCFQVGMEGGREEFVVQLPHSCDEWVIASDTDPKVVADHTEDFAIEVLRALTYLKSTEEQDA